MLRPWIIQMQVDKDSSKAIYLQIADHMIHIIKDGAMKSGDALPSSRQLATELNINRNTVIKALDILLAEGWLSSQERKGIFVSANLPIKAIKSKTSWKKEDEKEQTYKKPIISFDSGLPNTQIAPIEELARAYRQIFSRKARFNLMANTSEFGMTKFRESISQMLNQTRCMHTDASQICVTRGSQMALFLIAHTLLEKDDIILVESPGYSPAWKTFRHAGAKLLPMQIDDKGICVDEIEKIVKQKKIKAVYITPHHQYPTTVTMSLARRLQLIELSNRYGFTIIEDDYDSDFHFGQRPIAPLSSLSGAKNTIYIGTFSKMISASLRIGYLVADANFIAKVGKLQSIIDLQGDNIMEQAILELIETGVMKKHIRKASKLYKNRRDYFSTLLDTHLAGKISYKVPEGGLAFWLELKREQDLYLLNKQLNKRGVSIVKVDNYSFDRPINGLRLGYASLSEEQLKKGILVLSELIR